MKRPAIIEHMHYIAKRTFKGHALYITLSNEKAKQKKAAIEQALNEDEIQASAQIWPLPNTDVVLFFNNNKAHHLILLALKLKTILGETEADKCIQTYDLKTQYTELYTRIYDLVLVPDTHMLHGLSVMQRIPHKSFTYQDLQKTVDHLKSTSITHLIRKQPIWKLNQKQSPLMISWFVCLSDVRRALIPAVDIHENPYLYKGLRIAAEKKIFEKIKEKPDFLGAFNISVQELNAESVRTWINAHAQIQKKDIFFDLALDDVLENFLLFKTLQATLMREGYRFIIRVNEIPPYLNMANLPVDFIKVPCALLDDFEMPADLLPKIIVTHVPDKNAARQLRDKGYTLIQGLLKHPFG